MDNHYPADVTLKRINTIVGSYWEFPWGHSQIHYSFKEILRLLSEQEETSKKSFKHISMVSYSFIIFIKSTVPHRMC